MSIASAISSMCFPLDVHQVTISTSLCTSTSVLCWILLITWDRINLYTFCPFCSWETRQETQEEIHLMEEKKKKKQEEKKKKEAAQKKVRGVFLWRWIWVKHVDLAPPTSSRRSHTGGGFPPTIFAVGPYYIPKRAEPYKPLILSLLWMR